MEFLSVSNGIQGCKQSVIGACEVVDFCECSERQFVRLGQ